VSDVIDKKCMLYNINLTLTITLLPTFQIRVFSQTEYINLTDLVLDLNVKLLQVFESYFNIEYSLPKLGTY